MFLNSLSATIFLKNPILVIKLLFQEIDNFDLLEFRKEITFHLFFVAGSVTVEVFFKRIIVSITGSVTVGIVFVSDNCTDNCN